MGVLALFNLLYIFIDAVKPQGFSMLLVFSLLSLSSAIIHGFRIPFELETDISTITCRKCVQLWTTDPDNNPLSCGPNSETCTGNACFMRQCKRCGIYQYITGCVRLTEWQIRDLQISRQKVELLNTRAGASMLCEDNANHTTCICNSRDRCNDIHARVPFSTYSGSLFRGVVNVEAAIADFDPVVPRLQSPRHMFASHWYPSSSTLSIPVVLPYGSLFIALFLLNTVF